MDGIMSEDGSLNSGNFDDGTLGITRGALYGRREARDRKGPRRHEPPDDWLDREVKGLFVTWKAGGGEGPYASRQIADVAHGIRHPHRVIARRVREAADEDVPHDRIRRLGEIFIEYSERLRRRRMKLIA